MPHMYLVILILMLFVALLTYVVPAGQFTRTETGAVDPNSFTYIDQTPVGFMTFCNSVFDGFVQSANVVGLVLICAGAIQVINYTGAYSAGIQALIRKAHGNKLAIVIVFFTIFTGMGVIGYLDGLYPFYPILISVFMTLGYDRMVGTAVILLSTAVGFTSGIMNPYTVGVCQTLVGLPMYSGIGFRFIGLAVFYVIALVSLISYCKKIDKDPSKSIMGANYRDEQVAPIQMDEELEFTTTRKIILIVFFVSVIISVVGALKWGWGLTQITAMYVPATVLTVIIARINPNEACSQFALGMKNVVATTMVIALSRSVSVLLTSGNIIDTFIKGMSDMLGGSGEVVTLLVIYLFITAFNFLVSSGSGKAVMMMPILRPLGEMLGINQQVMVLAYQYGDGLTNTFWPTSSVTQLSLCGMDYGKWIKFAWKPYLAMIASAFVLIVIANGMGYGPF